MSAVSRRWEAYIGQGVLKYDAAQMPILRCYDRLHRVLQDTKEKRVPRGLYVYGSVGTGKSAAMEAFYESVENARRWHYHEFMLEVHDLMKKMPVRDVGDSLASRSRILCLDELQITDLADGLILRQVLTAFWKQNGVLVATSNREPEALYENGPSRRYILPLIQDIRNRCLVRCIKSDRDHRREVSTQVSSSTEVDFIQTSLEHFFGTTEFEWQFQLPVTITSRRALSIPRVAKTPQNQTCLVVNVNDLCDADLGAIDYSVLADHFDGFILTEVPQFNLRQHDQARRFITLIDVLYDKRKRLAYRRADNTFPSSSSNDPDTLFFGASAPTNHQTDPVAAPAPEAENNKDISTTLVSVRELEFAFQRASSRLREMASTNWPPAIGFGVARTTTASAPSVLDSSFSCKKER